MSFHVDLGEVKSGLFVLATSRGLERQFSCFLIAVAGNYAVDLTFGLLGLPSMVLLPSAWFEGDFRGSVLILEPYLVGSWTTSPRAIVRIGTTLVSETKRTSAARCTNRANRTRSDRIPLKARVPQSTLCKTKACPGLGLSLGSEDCSRQRTRQNVRSLRLLWKYHKIRVHCCELIGALSHGSYSDLAVLRVDPKSSLSTAASCRQQASSHHVAVALMRVPKTQRRTRAQP